MKPLTIFRAGTHTDMGGQTLEFGEAMLAEAARSYDPAAHEAPLVVGHPKDNSPAWGWVKRLAAQGTDLVAFADQIDPDFAGMVKAGRYKKVSASFYLPGSPANPKPGTLYLRHVGFLGGVAPALKGLPPVEFGEAEGVIEFSEDLPPDSGDEGHTVAPEGDEMDEKSKTRLAELEAENAQLKADAAAKVTADRHAANVSFCESLIADGKITPAVSGVIVAALDELFGMSGSARQPVSFGEGDGAKPLPEALKAALQALPKVVEYGEVGADKGVPAHVSFAAPAGFDVDPRAAELHAKAKAHQAAHPGTEYLAAIAAVSGR